MNFYNDRLNNELKNILNFWFNHAYQEQGIATEVYNSGTINKNALTGSLFLSKVLYGTSAACLHLKEERYKPLADKAYEELTTTFKNPKGGFFWAINNNGKVLHDEINVSYSQAFVLYGLIEYYGLTSNESVWNLLNEHILFIESILVNREDGSYCDGFSMKWDPLTNRTRSLGTHLHMLEAYVRLSEVLKNSTYNERIESLINLMITRFINIKTAEVIHQFDDKWKSLPNENWIGHNMETSWIICKAARKVKNNDLNQKCKDIAVKLCDKAIEQGFDRNYGGMFNRFDKKELIITDKEWWAQAESVIGFLNAYTITADKKYLSYAIRLLEYIDNIFSDPIDGEWYDSVSREGIPYRDKPKLHFWKSMYHNVRYCIETSNYLEKIYVAVGEKI